MKKFLKRMEKIIKAMEHKISVQKKGLGLLFSHNFDTLELIEKNLILLLYFLNTFSNFLTNPL